MFDDDIVRDILRRVVEAARSRGGFDDTLARSIERSVRHDWGGAQVYVAHGVEDRRAERNEAIQAAWDRGEHDVTQLAQRFGLSTKQVRRILF